MGKSKVKKQAEVIAATLKRAERREPIPEDKSGKIAASRDKDSVKFAIVMNEKLISITMDWTFIAETSETAIVEYIFKHMSEIDGGTVK